MFSCACSFPPLRFHRKTKRLSAEEHPERILHKEALIISHLKNFEINFLFYFQDLGK